MSQKVSDLLEGRRWEVYMDIIARPCKMYQEGLSFVAGNGDAMSSVAIHLCRYSFTFSDTYYASFLCLALSFINNSYLFKRLRIYL